MSYELHDAHGTLTLDMDTFEGLVAAVKAGTHDDIDERVLWGLQAAAHPFATFRLVVANRTHAFVHHVWMHEGAAGALMEEEQPGQFTFLTMLPEVLPMLVTRACRLGPRRPADRTERIAGVTAAALFSDDSEQRAAAIDALSPDPDAWVWRAEMTWTGVDGPTGSALAVIDSQEGPSWLIPAAGRVRQTPTSPTDILLALINLFPSFDDIAAPS